MTNTNLTGIELYNAAKEAYYNGEPIMTDYEFDELERELGLENKSYVGTRHNPSYTIEHPFIMGSLSKIQIKEDANGDIDWPKYFEELANYINYTGQFSNSIALPIIVTPKYDGCSFEAVVNDNGEIDSISSRGDGEFGKDLSKHLIHLVSKSAKQIYEQIPTGLVLRGEVLVDRVTFGRKYQNFVNPRSFVSGILNRDYCDDADFKDMLNDLCVVIYDVRTKVDDNWLDIDWVWLNYETKPGYYELASLFPIDFEDLYKRFDDFRQNCEFALDGFVIKPQEAYRLNNTTEHRPKDCVAIKFVPMLEETVVEEIIWSTRKTNEMIPVVKVKPVIMDGKVVSKASGHNYGYLIDNKISVGTKIILSLAGDIIPFIYKVTDTSEFSELNMNLPTEEYPGQYRIDGCHLLKMLSSEELNHKKFINSCGALNIPGLGGANAEKIYLYLKDICKGDEFFGIPEKEVPNNILMITSLDVERALGGKTGASIAKELNKILVNITLKDIISSMCIDSCGPKVIEQIEKELLTNNGDFTHLNRDAYNWLFNAYSEEYQELTSILVHLNRTFEDFRQVFETKSENQMSQIPVILTGEPNNYASKGEFLKCNPQYRLTGSWKEVQIVFTNSLESNTGKMNKAREKNIEIKLY